MKYTAEEVRETAKMVGDEFSPHAGSMLTELAARIEADEGAVLVATAGMFRGHHGNSYGVGFSREDAARLEELPVGTELFTRPPARAAQVDPAAKPRTLADFVNAPDAERAQIGQQVAARVDEMMAEPVAQTAQVDESRYTAIGRAFREVLADPSVAWRDTGAKTFIDRVCQTTSCIESTPTAEPVAQGESGVIRNVGDSRFESWFSEYVVGQNGAKQQARDAYGAGLAEQAERLAAQPAQLVDIEAIRKVIESHINEAKKLRHDPESQDYLYEQADKLEAALQEKGNG